VEVNLVGGEAVDSAFGPGDAFEDRDGALPGPRGKRAVLNQRADRGEGAVFVRGMVMRVIGVPMWVGMGCAVSVRVQVGVIQGIGVARMIVRMGMSAGGLSLVVDVELGTGDLAFLGTMGLKLITLEPKFVQLGLERRKIDAQIEHSADEHVAANAAEAVEVEGLHGQAAVPARALIWLAA
jgi:hypothetical protein